VVVVKEEVECLITPKQIGEHGRLGSELGEHMRDWARSQFPSENAVRALAGHEEQRIQALDDA
jgi:hypothetical protein